MNTINVARYRNTPYTVNYYPNGSGTVKTYRWNASKKKPDVQSVSQEVINWLAHNSVAFDDGELVIIEDSDVSKEEAMNISDKESYENNTHTYDEIVKILEGNTNKLKAELKNVTVASEKNYILSVAKDIKLDSSSKQKILADWMGIPVEMLFDDEAEE